MPSPNFPIKANTNNDGAQMWVSDLLSKLTLTHNPAYKIGDFCEILPNDAPHAYEIWVYTGQTLVAPFGWELHSTKGGSGGGSGATGYTGYTGPAGTTGATGATGYTGPAGLPGAIGATGATGYTGPAGLPGLPGLPGAIGATGATGYTGPAGLPGLPGLQGPTGYTGYTGPAGAGVKYVQNFNTTAGIPIVITHNLNTLDFTYNVREGAIDIQVQLTRLNPNQVEIVTTGTISLPLAATITIIG